MITSDKRFFASYAREDSALVQPVLALLRAANPGAFLELDAVHPGNRWPERLAVALAEATTFIIFWSRHSLLSEALNGEWQSAISAQKEVVSVLIDSTPLPEPLQTRLSVEFKDLATMRHFRGGRAAALVCGIALVIAAAAVPFAGWKLGAWAPGGSAPLSSKTSPFAPAATSTNGASSTNPPATGAANADRESHLRDLLSKGRQLRESGDSTAAVTQFQEAAALDEKNPVSFVELAVTKEAMGLTQESLEHWRKVHQLGASAGLYFSLAEAKLRAANALTSPGDATSPVEETPDLTAPVEGIANGSVLGLLPITREDQPDAKSAARFVLHIPVKVRPKAHIDVHELIIHVLFYDFVDGKRVEETSANVKSHWQSPPADWVDSQTEQLEVEYQLPKPPTAADAIVDRKYYGYIIRLYYQEILQAAVAEPAALAKLHPPPPTVTGEPAKPRPPRQTPAPLPQGAFHQNSPVSLSAPAAASTPIPTTLPSDEMPAPAPPPPAATVAVPAWPPWPWVLPSVLLAGLAVVSFIGSRAARRGQRRFDPMIIELAARRLAAGLAEPIEEEPVATEELLETNEEPSQSTVEDLDPAPANTENEPASEQPENDAETAEGTGEEEPESQIEEPPATTEGANVTTNSEEAETSPEPPRQKRM